MENPVSIQTYPSLLGDIQSFDLFGFYQIINRVILCISLVSLWALMCVIELAIGTNTVQIGVNN